ncbi:MAG: hypothetical protein CFE40_04365 [Burkholderiales bacterium PBB1]|nr:MAG: hypothetical protein CFE40_04365 [Burkholderiales bacterium PBB1]
MLLRMKLLIDSFWRAAAYCLHPRVIALSLMPLLLMAVAALGLGYFLWDPALAWVRAGLETQVWLGSVMTWFDSMGIGGLQALLAPLLIVFLAMPVIVIVSLLVVAALMTPAMLNLVAERRFQSLERRHGGSTTAGVFASLGATLMALVALVLSIPLWFVPPLVLILPPLIWGWLTYKVMTYDVLAEHATKEERREIVRRHRSALLGMGVLTGYLGAAPSLLWASGVLFLALAPVLVPVAIWIYTLVFAFSALWFSHYALAALLSLRAERAAMSMQASPAASPATVPEASAGLLPPPLI